MLDLNLNADSSYDRAAEEEDAEAEEKLSAAESSPGTSNSSIIVEAEVDHYSSSTRAAANNMLNFDLDALREEDEENIVAPTRELFPMMATGRRGFGDLHLNKNTNNQMMIDISFGGRNVVTDQVRAAAAQVQQQQTSTTVAKKSRRGPRSRSSQYRGVTFYRRTGRWESHIWDCGKQVYLGGFDAAHDAARAYDRAAIKFRGLDADINFNLVDYDEDMKQVVNLSKEEFVHILRRQSTGFSRDSSKFRGVALNKCERREAGIGQFLGKRAHDMAAINSNGREAVTSFEANAYDGMRTASDANQGCDMNLDLNLGISCPSNCHGPNKDQGLGYPQHDYNTPYSVQDGRRATTEKTSSDPTSIPNLYPHCIRIHEVQTRNPRNEANYMQNFPNMIWHGNGQQASARPLPVPAMFSFAASSGFSSPAPPAAAFHPMRPPNLTAHTLYFAPPSAAAAVSSSPSTSQYHHYQMKPC